MTNTPQLRLLAALILTSVPALHAQKPPDPAGHWKGAISAPGRQFRFEADLALNETGQLSGVVALPGENLIGIPLTISLSGSSIKFHARVDQPFDGELSADGKQILGEATVEGNVLPFAMRRTGDAVSVTPITGVLVGGNLLGSWSGTLNVQGSAFRLKLTISKGAADTSIASVVNLDQGGLELPAVIRRSAPDVELQIATGDIWTGTLSPDGKELVGTFSQSGQSAPLKFAR